MSRPAMSGAEPWAAWAIAWVSGGVQRRGDAQRSGDLAGQVGQDVAEHVLGDDDVELVGVADQVHGHRVDVEVVELDVGVLARRSRGTRRGTGRWSVFSTLALCTMVTLLRRCRASSKATCGDLLHRGAGDDAHARSRRWRGHELAGAGEGVAVGVEALGVLPHDHQIGARRPRVATLECLGGPDVGEQIEVLADGAGRVELDLNGSG